MRRLLLGVAAAISLAAIIPWTLKAADSTLSNLSAGGAVSGTDLFYDVQTVGVGGVKVTGTQVKTFMSASPSFTGTVTFPDNGTWAASGFTGTLGSITTLTIGGINSGTQCLQANGSGLVSGSGAGCSGSNAVTSVTSGDGSVNVNPTTGTVIVTLGTAHSNTWTAAQTFNSGITSTTGAFTTSLTGTTATFQTVTINNLTPTGPNCLQETGGVVQATNSACGSGSGNVTSVTSGDGSVNINPTTGAVIVTLGTAHANTWTAAQTFNSGLTGTTGAFTTSLTSPTATHQTLTITGLTPTGPNCLQETGGVVQATNGTCGSGGGTPSTGGPVLPTSEYLGGASGQLSPSFYVPATNTIANQGAMEGIALATTATASLATAVLQFNMPEVIPTSPMRLRLIYMANATTGNVSTWIQDALTSVSNSLGVSALTSETTKTISITSADVMIEKKFALTQTPTAGSNQILTVLLNLTTTVGTTVVIQPSIIWE